MSNQDYGYGGEQEREREPDPQPEPQTDPQVNPAQMKLPPGETPQLGQADAHITGVDGIMQVSATLSFGGGSSVSMDMAIPDSTQPEAPTHFELYASSDDSTPSNNPSNLVVSSQSRPSNGRLRGSRSFTNRHKFYVELKFKQSGNRILSGSVDKNSAKHNENVTLELD